MKEKDVIKNIRFNALKSFIGFFIFSIIPNICFLFSLTNHGDRSLLWIFLILAGLIDWLLIKTLIIVINPLKDPIFEKYGSPKKVKEILNELNNNVIYQDKNIIMSKKYIMVKNNFSELIAFKDVLGIHKLQHRKNGVTNYYGVVLTDKYGCEHTYTYRVKSEKKCDELLLITASLCPNAIVGYTKQQKQYIEENKVK